jgi:hypothetical protein
LHHDHVTKPWVSADKAFITVNLAAILNCQISLSTKPNPDITRRPGPTTSNIHVSPARPSYAGFAARDGPARVYGENALTLTANR